MSKKSLSRLLERMRRKHAKHQSSTQGIYFDISDVVSYALSESRVTGIQRVQMRVISEFSSVRPGSTYVVFQSPITGQICAARAARLFDEAEFDPVRLLLKLGLLNWRRFPKKRLIVARIPPHAGRLRVLWEQMKTYLYALAWSDELRQSGLLPQWGADRPPVADLERVENLDAGTLVFLGTNWGFDRMQSLAAGLKHAGGRIYQLVHDLIPLRYPEFCSNSTIAVFSDFIERSPDFSTHYLAVSDHTATDLRRFLGSRHQMLPVRVLKLAHEFSGFARGSRLPAPYVGGCPYILFVGTLDRRKNIENLAKAWILLGRKLGKGAPKLVVAGKPGWDSGNFFRLLSQESVLQELIIYERAPSDGLLARLYSNCLALILPSFAEGWGLPVGEAAWFGKWSLITDGTSLPEVCPTGSFLLSGTSPEDIAAGVGEFIVKREKTGPTEVPLDDLRTWREVAQELNRIVEADTPAVRS